MADETQDQTPAAQPPATKPAKQETGTSSTGAKGLVAANVETKQDKGTSSTGARESTTKSEQRVVRTDGTSELE